MNKLQEKLKELESNLRVDDYKESNVVMRQLLEIQELAISDTRCCDNVKNTKSETPLKKNRDINKNT